jgi:predicted dehydrogenase
MTEPVRVAVVGLGYWGPNLARNLVEIDEAELVLVCDRDEAALARLARRFPAPRRTTRFDDVLADESVEAVVLATPVSTHYRLALEALAVGKHVFVEKPLASSTDEAATLLAVANSVGRTLMPGHTFLYSPPVRMIRDLIAAGELGDVYFVSTSRVNLGLHQPDASVVWDLGPHDLSILRYWLDEAPVTAGATARRCVLPDTPDVAFVSLGFPSGTIAHVELAWLAPSKLRRTTVVGSRKMVVYDDSGAEPVRIFDSGVQLPDPATFGEYRLTYRTGDILSPHLAAAEPLAAELRDFCHAVRTGSEPVSSARLGLEVVAAIEAVDASLAAGGAPVPVRQSTWAPAELEEVGT